MEFVFENPENDFTIREIEKETKLPRATISDYLIEMKKIGFSNKYSLFFKTKKINYFIEKIVKSGLIDFLASELNPSCIILFGSIRKGESGKDSDIDLFVETSIKKELILDRYEKALNHKISLFVENKISNLQENLFNNIINGIKLYGTLKIK